MRSKPPSFYDLDNSWYEYMKADREERKQMCEDALACQALAFTLGMLVIVGVAIVALCKGWI